MNAAAAKQILLVDRPSLRRSAYALLLQHAAPLIHVEVGEDLTSASLRGIHLVLIATSQEDLASGCAQTKIERVKTLVPGMAVAAISDNDRSASERDLMHLGFDGSLTPSVAETLLPTIINLLCAGGSFFSREALLESAAPPGETTPREHQVLTLVAAGCANKEIAYRLDISENTVKAHLYDLMRKKKVTNRTQLVLQMHAALQHSHSAAAMP